MCLPLDYCFGFGTPRTDDDLGLPSKGQRNGAGHHYNGNGGGHHYNGNAGGHYYNGNSYPAHGAAAGAEADRKASNDVRPRAWHGHATTGAQDKATGADGTLKPQAVARNEYDKVAAADGARGVAQRNYYYEPAHKEDAADSYYPAATATADHESPSEAFGRE